ncbi:KpsF/GutQ family sugar-phosphate isomerase [Aristophania vespae]|uniref:KpsF/GutQ family sugar-phosphate isomerase n=1 Tax=Aristophania vespae TaxID=2697033 RepID=A0A6P1NCW4_9PROT|nr:KpsF/GutQ family sugar-phosphate isomerase [Aristophania vespae]QHI95358.1 KpsF/GutQ family sugar-phosphate isomerase [Aristophania vespae]UMM64628.1 Arabinose 5-phosphate isomerase KdsD [Aristophania vespae]
MSHSSLTTAQTTLAKERVGLERLETAFKGPLGKVFCQVVDHLIASKGRVAVTGVGKSGHIARKIQTSLASTGTPSFFIYPTEAAHGDLGMIQKDDNLLAFSTSGETAELALLLQYAKVQNIPLIAVTSNSESTLARASQFCLCLPQSSEACPIGLAPTTSSLMQLALGDALMSSLLAQRGFSYEDFSKFHPAGQLGARLRPISDIMHKSKEMPLGSAIMPLKQVVMEMTRKAFGCMGVIDEDGILIGLIADGDLRPALSKDLEKTLAKDVMNRHPATARTDMRVQDVLHFMTHRDTPISSLFIVDENHRPLGIVHLHDLLRTGVL